MSKGARDVTLAGAVLRTVVAPALLVAVVPHLFAGYQLSILTTVATHLITALGFNIVFGYAGTLSFGHAAFALVGSYAVALGQLRWGWSFLLATIVAVTLCAAVAAVAALPTLRMAPFAIAVVTLLYLPALNSSIQYFKSFTFGGDGAPAKAASLTGNQEWYLVAGVAAVVWLGCRNLIRSPLGRAWELTRTAPELAESLAISTTAVRLGAVALSAGLSGLAGAMWPIRHGFTGPDTFSLNYAILILVIVVIGGQATVNGPVAGAIVVAAVTLGLSEVFTSGGTVSTIVYAISVLAVVLLAPGGVIELGRRLATAFVGRRRNPGAELAAGPATANDRPQPAVLVDHTIDELLPVPTGGTLAAEAVSWSVGGMRVLSDVDVTIRPGTVHGLIGPNGAGKTSLLNVICGYLEPSTGRVTVDGQELRGRASRRSGIGIARSFQHPALLENRSVLENVVLGVQSHRHATLAEYLLRLPRAGRAERAAEADATRWIEICGLRGLERATASTLGPGQRRQLELARALATQPRVLLLDEPAAGLTATELRLLEDVIRALARRGIAVALIEHHFDLVRRVCDEVTVIEAGAVIFHGSPADAAADARVAAAYLGTDAEAGDLVVEPT